MRKKVTEINLESLNFKETKMKRKAHKIRGSYRCMPIRTFLIIEN